MRRLASSLSNLALTVASLGVCLGLLEVGLRLFWGGYYLKEPKGYVQPSVTRGWENKPSVRVDYGEPEFRTVVSHNSWGFRGPEVPLEKPPGRCRILVLGDSFAYGVGVENDETFSARLEQMEARLQVINAGVNAYGTSQELLLLVEKGLSFAPDLVIVAFFWNDVANSYDRDVARFRLEDGRLLYPEPIPIAAADVERPVRRRYLRHSYAYRFLSDRIKTLQFHARLAFRIPTERRELLTTEEREDAWELEYALLRELARIVQANGATALVVVIPEQVQVQNEARVLGLSPEDYEVQDRLIAFAESAGIPVLDPLPALRAAHEEDGAPLYYFRDRHLRERGHRVLAGRILEEIQDLGLVPCPIAGVAAGQDAPRSPDPAANPG